MPAGPILMEVLMKTLIAAILVTLLAACSHMGMGHDTSGGMSATGSSAAGSDYSRRDNDTFHSWIN
jgi:hypothetical protein